MSAACKGKVISESTRAKISAAKQGCVGTFKGKHHTEEAKIRVGKASKGRRLGKKATEETKKKISAALKGRPNPKVSAALMGKKLSAAHKIKLSNAKKGKPWSQAKRDAYVRKYKS